MEGGGLCGEFLHLSACKTFNTHGFALPHTDLALYSGHAAAVAMLLPCLHAAGEELYPPRAAAANPDGGFFGREPQDSGLA